MSPIRTEGKETAMRPFTIPDLAALLAGQALALVLGWACTWGVWAWLAEVRPFH